MTEKSEKLLKLEKRVHAALDGTPTPKTSTVCWNTWNPAGPSGHINPLTRM